MRHDHYRNTDAVTSPRLGLIWLAGSEQTVKLLAGKAYRPANAYEREYSNGINYLGNTGLAPETIGTLEAVLEQQLGRNQQLSLSAYHYRLNNLIVQQMLANGSLQYQNQPQIRAHGLEAVWRWRRDNGLIINASVATGVAEDQQGQRLSYSPRWIGKLQIGAPLSGSGWQLAAETSYLSATPYHWQGADYQEAAPWQLNLSLSRTTVSPGLDGYLRIINLFNCDCRQPASEEIPIPALPGKPRTLEAGLRYAF